MSQKFRMPTDQTQFVPVGAIVDNIFKGGSYTLSAGYVDHDGKFGDKGKYIEFVSHVDPKRGPVAKRFRFDQSLGRLMSRNSDKDSNGKSQTDFLKNHPECEGSPYGFYTEGLTPGTFLQTGVTFRELNSAKDAEVALRADRARVKAEASAIELDETTLEEIANIIGYYGETDDQMRLKVVEFARKKPGEYDYLLTSDDRPYKAIVRKALAEGVFKQVGPMIKWADTNASVGNNEDDAVAYLKQNKEMLIAIQDKIKLDLVGTASTKNKRK